MLNKHSTRNIISDKVDTAWENAIRDAASRTLNDMCREQVQAVVADTDGVIWSFVSAALYRSLRTANFPRRYAANMEGIQHEQ